MRSPSFGSEDQSLRRVRSHRQELEPPPVRDGRGRATGRHHLEEQAFQAVQVSMSHRLGNNFRLYIGSMPT